MNDLFIKVNKVNRDVIACKTNIGTDGENLQTKLIFSFENEFVDGIARLEYIIDNNKNFINLIKENNTYYTPIKNVITKEGNIEMQLVITENDNKDGTPIFKSSIFTLYCEKAINAVSEAPDGYTLWIDEANKLLLQLEKINIEGYKRGNITYITITSKDGTYKTLEIRDGLNGKNGINGKDGETGNGIASITKTGTVGNVDTYTITYTNGDTTTFTVTNSTVTDQEFDSLEETVERYKTLSNLLPRVNGTGTDLSLSNTGNGVIMDNSLSGQTEQDSTTGKNLLNDTTVKRTVPTSGAITVIVNTTIQAGTYRFACFVDNEPVLTSNIYSMSFRDGQTGVVGSAVPSSTITVKSEQAETIDNVLIYFNSNFTDTYKGKEITGYMICSGNDLGDYEPYTGGIPAPNPSYPYPINKATGNQNVLIQNKNLVNQNNAEINKKIFSSGAYTSPTGTNTTDYIYIGNFTNITIIHDGTDGNWNTCYFDENKNVVSGGGNGYSNSKQIFSVGDKKYIKFSYATTCQPALYGDLDISTYEPHQEQNYPITMGSLEAYDTDEFMQNSGKNLISSVARSNNVLYFNGSNENIYPFKAGTYTISYSDTNNCSLYYKTANTSSTSLGQNKTVTFTINEDFNIWLYRSGMIDNEVTNIMLNEGSTALPYEPYGTDEWYLKSNYGKVVLDGTENWTIQSYNTEYSIAKSLFVNNNIPSGSTNLLSNYFTVVSSNIGASIGQFRAGSSYLNFNYDDGVGGINNFKNWLSTHNTLVVYELSTPTFTKITDTTLIGQLNALKNNARSYKDTTNITVTGDLPLVISASCYRDLTNLFESEGV